MLNNIIEDGKGSGVRAEVDALNRLQVLADIQNVSQRATLFGSSFEISSELVTLTTANPSAILFLKNNEVSELIIKNIRFQSFQSTGGANGVPTWQIFRQPTTGTIISGALLATPINANFGSSTTISITSFRGVEGSTFTDGTVFTTQFGATVPHGFIASPETYEVVLPRGASMGVRVTPPAGNTSVLMNATIRFYLNT